MAKLDTLFRVQSSLEFSNAWQDFLPEQDHFVEFWPARQNELAHANPCVIDQALSDLLIAATAVGKSVDIGLKLCFCLAEIVEGCNLTSSSSGSLHRSA
jgi:hypothetical protein